MLKIVAWKSGDSLVKPRHGQTTQKEESHVSKKIAKAVKLELPGGDAKPGPKLASAGLPNMAKFTMDFNAKTADRRGEIVPVLIITYEDKTFEFFIKTTPVAPLLLKAAGLEKGGANGRKNVVGHVSRAKIREIAEYKMPDLNCNDIDAAMRIIEGTALNMGIVVDD